MDALREYQVSFDRTALLRSAPTRGRSSGQASIILFIVVRCIERGIRRGDPISGSFQGDQDDPAGADRMPSGQLSYRAGPIGRGRNQRQRRVGDVLPGHDCRHADRRQLQVRSFSTMRRRVLFRVECDRLAVALKNRRASQ